MGICFIFQCHLITWQRWHSWCYFSYQSSPKNKK
jgi:hypothetical protein